jgi:UDP-N-acetyl-D-glucosamine dehydrogenase
MPHFVVEKIQNALNEHGKAVKGSRIHILGVAYKRDIDDVRESPALDIIHLLQRRGATVTYSDPYVPSIRMDDELLFSTDAASALPQTDCAAIVTDHSDVDYGALAALAPLVVDTRNALRGVTGANIVRL